jgi:hypothetical protein
MHPTLSDSLRATRRELTTLLLVGAMLAPLAAALAGWPVRTPLDVPLRLHVGLLMAVGMVAYGVARLDDVASARRRWVGWLLVPLFAAGFATILRERANVFYTERALIEGMTVLFIVHAATGALRLRALRRLGPCRVRRVPRWGGRRVGEWRRRLHARCLPTTPAIRLADMLTMACGWLVLASWSLIALEHRHPAGPLLLAAGAMEVLAFLALIPDALASSGWLAPATAAPESDPERDAHLASPGDAAPRGRAPTGHVEPSRCAT